MRNWIRKWMGIDELEARHQQELTLAEERRVREIEIREEKIRELEFVPEPIEPRVEIVSAGIGEDGMTRLQLDWNDEFVQHLKDNGYEGKDDEDIVNQWLNALMAQHQNPTRTTNGMDDMNRERDSFDP
jgi:hypothetical protein